MTITAEQPIMFKQPTIIIMLTGVNKYYESQAQPLNMAAISNNSRFSVLSLVNN